MTQQGNQLWREKFCCSICLDLLKEPVTLQCGHSYCMRCIQNHWDTEEGRGTYSCPQCRKDFTPRPELKKNILVADLVEELKKIDLQAAPADHCYAGAEDAACDVCTERKLKAAMSCLDCQASYCEEHLQPHYNAAPLKKHKLVKVMDMHSVAAERAEKQKELETTLRQIQQRVQDREENLKLLQQEVEAINGSADEALEQSEKVFTSLIQQLQRRSSEVQQQIRSQQETEVGLVTDLQEKQEQEIAELKEREAELKTLMQIQDHTHFLHSYTSLPTLNGPTHSSCFIQGHLRYFEDVTAAMLEVRGQIEKMLSETFTKIAQIHTDVLLSEREPETRADFLKYSQELTLDPNTANQHLLLSEGLRTVTLVRAAQSYPNHPDRFTVYRQVLSRETLSRRCYWEVEWGRGRGGGGVEVAITYKNISRAGDSDECRFGYNNKSWTLDCDGNDFNFYHHKTKSPVSGPGSCRVGVYLDQGAGTVSYYSVSETMTLLHRGHGNFTQPLYAGLGVWYFGSPVEFCHLN